MPRQNTSPADYPQAVLQQIEQLAHNIAIARKRRGETQAQWAKKLGVSQPTFARIERGDPGVSMASYMMCMWLINPAVGLADLISPLNDRAALEREVTKVSKKRQESGATGRTKRATASASSAGEHRPQKGREDHTGSAAGAGSTASTPSADSRSPMVDLSKLSEPGKMSDPLVDIRKALERATGGKNSTAEGLAALLLKNRAKRS
jgi:DNA-binding XRE family transcriptional regulator